MPPTPQARPEAGGPPRPAAGGQPVAFKMFYFFNRKLINISDISRVEFVMQAGTFTNAVGESVPLDVAIATRVYLNDGVELLYDGIDAERVRLFLAPFAISIPEPTPEWTAAYESIVKGQDDRNGDGTR
jgi:hypothetical protein